MPTTAGAAYSAQRGNEQRHIVTMALRSTASVRTGCSTGNMPRVAPFLAPAWSAITGICTSSWMSRWDPPCRCQRPTNTHRTASNHRYATHDMANPPACQVERACAQCGRSRVHPR